MSRNRPEAIQDTLSLSPMPHEFRLEDSQILGTWRYYVVFGRFWWYFGSMPVVCRWHDGGSSPPILFYSAAYPVVFGSERCKGRGG